MRYVLVCQVRHPFAPNEKRTDHPLPHLIGPLFDNIMLSGIPKDCVGSSSENAEVSSI
jgi:hypothetical protein